jgi:hypothetical protein
MSCRLFARSLHRRNKSATCTVTPSAGNSGQLGSNEVRLVPVIRSPHQSIELNSPAVVIVAVPHHRSSVGYTEPAHGRDLQAAGR